jgi:hypothetical protein
VCGDDEVDVKNRAWHAARELGTTIPEQLLRAAATQ